MVRPKDDGDHPGKGPQMTVQRHLGARGRLGVGSRGQRRMWKAEASSASRAGKAREWDFVLGEQVAEGNSSGCVFFSKVPGVGACFLSS